jgi:hypothetical protein
MNTLKQGSKGGDVKLLQKYMGVTQDGIWGPKTTEAVKKWQTSKGLTPDGIVGPKTWLKLIENDLKSGQLTDADYIKAAIDLDVEVAVLKAVKTVESGGKAMIDGIPVMLFEGHVFWNQLKMRGIDPNKYVKGNGPINEETNDKLYAHMILTGETTSKRLSLANLLDRGLKGAPMGAMNLSKKELKDLLVYIEENF